MSVDNFRNEINARFKFIEVVAKQEKARIESKVSDKLSLLDKIVITVVLSICGFLIFIIL